MIQRKKVVTLFPPFELYFRGFRLAFWGGFFFSHTVNWVGVFCSRILLGTCSQALMIKEFFYVAE